MRKQNAGRLFAAVLMGLAAGCQGPDEAPSSEQVGTQEAQAASQCVSVFEGVSHCAKGSATLTPTGEGLQVSGLADASQDGVASNFSKAVSWARLSQHEAGAPLDYTLAARDGDQVVSTLRVEPGDEPNQLVMTPSFTGGAPGGSEVQVNVYLGGVLQGSTTGMPNARYVIITDIFGYQYIMSEFAFRDRFFWPMPWKASETSTDAASCVWRTSLRDGNTFTINLNGEDITGDQIAFIEQIGDGAYPYTSFSGIDTTSASEAFTILNESATQEP